MARITMAQYKTALKKRYMDLLELLSYEQSMGNVEYDSKTLLEIRAIAAIAKLHGVNIRLDE